MRVSRRMLAAWVVCALGPAIVGAQGQKEPEAPTPFKALKYRSIGPAAGGRVSRVAGVPGDPTIYYAATASGGVWKSTDAGATWKPVFDDQPVSSMGSIAVAPSDPNVVYVGSGEANIRGNVAAGNGIYKSMDAGKTWTHVWKQEGQIGQFYHVSADTRRPYHVAGAMQDLGTAQGPSMTLSDGISLDDWYSVGGGEAGHVVSDWSDPNIVYAGEYLGIITRYDHRTGEARNVSAWPENPSGHGGTDMKYRFQWTAPIAISPHDAKVVYHGAQVVFRTSDGGQSWDTISPDLTRNDKTKQQWSGGPITGDNTGVETYGTVFAIAESPRTAGVIWAGSDDGLIHITRDAGKTWSNVTSAMTGFPEWGTVSMIEPSPHDAATAYAAIDAHRLDDARPYLYRTKDYGRSWTRIDSTLAKDDYLHAVREDPARKGLLYVGTERGVMFSTDDGTSWKPLKLNLPTVAVHDLVVAGDDLVVGTHGRSIWILDDLQPIREMSDKIADSTVHLFAPAGAVRWRLGGGSWAYRHGRFQNPPGGAAIYYFLKDKTKGELKIEILSGDKVVRTLSSIPREPDNSSDDEDPEDLKKAALSTEAGVQRAVWDLTWEGARKIKGAKIDTGDPATGPRAIPGNYQVRLTVDGTTRTAAVDGGCRSARKCGAVGPRSAVGICAACARRHFEADRSGQSHPLRPRTGSGPRQVARGAEI